jgi:hypothetical protein
MKAVMNVAFLPHLFSKLEKMAKRVDVSIDVLVSGLINKQIEKNIADRKLLCNFRKAQTQKHHS